MTAGSSEILCEPHDHIVNFYDADDDLVVDVSRFVADGLREEATVLAIATRAHVDAVDALLAADGVDVAAARRSGRFLCLDATATLGEIMVDGTPDRDRFRAVVGQMVAAAGRTGRPVRAFGEMVALLWDEGNVSAAIDLEALWNDLGRDHRFSLYCAYAISSLAGADDLPAAGLVCTHHSSVIAPVSYAAPTTVRGGDVPERSHLFVPVPQAIQAVRRFVADALIAWSEDGLRGDATLVASELATNALRHANSAFRVSVRRNDATITIAVHDVSPSLPIRRDPVTHEMNGRGVAMVERISVDWGTDQLPDGKVVWAELARSTR